MRERRRETIRAASKRRYWLNVERSRRLGRKKARALYVANPQRARERSRQWREANPEKVKEQIRKWQVQNRDRKAVIESNRRARRRQATGKYTLSEWRAKCAEHGDRCFYCGSRGRLTADHVVPLTRGGSNWITNIVPACSGCNSSKSGKDPADWIQWRAVVGRALTPAARELMGVLALSMVLWWMVGGSHLSTTSEGVVDSHGGP